MVFPGLIDLLLFLENGLCLPMNVEVVIEILIHLWVTGFGLFAIATIWRHGRGDTSYEEALSQREAL